MSPPTRDRSALEALGLRMMASRGLASVAQMRALPAEALVEATAEEVGGLALRFGPIVDGALLRRSPTERFLRGEQAAVPLLIGDTADEFSRFVPEIVTPLAFERQMRSDFGNDADHYIALYPHASSADARRARLQSMVYPIHEGTLGEPQAHAARAPTFVYRFDQVPPGPEAARLGAYHGADVPYMFGSAAEAAGAWTEADQALSQLMMEFWTNFAKTGNPNGPRLPEWPAFDLSRPMLIRLGETSAAMPLLDQARIKAARRPHDVRWVQRFTQS
jgi:para-nitrobenzyl esterase